MDALDYFAIQNLVYTYAAKVDAGDFDGVGAMFEHSDVWFPGDKEPTSKKGKNIMGRMMHEWTRRYAETGNPRTRHVTTNLIIEPDGPNKARGQCYVVVLQQTPAFKLQPIIAGTYIDRFEKADGKWRFSERREVMDLIGDLSHHLLQPFGPG